MTANQLAGGFVLIVVGLVIAVTSSDIARAVQADRGPFWRARQGPGNRKFIKFQNLVCGLGLRRYGGSRTAGQGVAASGTSLLAPLRGELLYGHGLGVVAHLRQEVLAGAVLTARAHSPALSACEAVLHDDPLRGARLGPKAIEQQ